MVQVSTDELGQRGRGGCKMIPQVEDYVRGEDEGDHVSEVHASGRRTSSSVEVEWLAGLKLVEDLVELSAGSKRDRSEACKHV